MNRQVAYSLLTVKEVSEEQRVIRGMATTPDVDRQGDIVEPLGVEFKNPAPLLMMHDHSQPVGSVTFGKPTAKGVPFEATFPVIQQPSQLAARVEEAWQSVKNGLIRAVSIGFRAIEYTVIEDTGGYRFTRCEVMELSLVAVPAQANATITQIKAYDSEVRAALGKKSDERKALKPSSGVSEKKTLTVKLQTKETENMKISEKLKGFKEQLKTKKDELVKLAEKSADAGETFDAADQEAFDALEGEIKALEEHVVRFEKAEKASLASAKPVTQEDGLSEDAGKKARAPAQPIKAKEKADSGIEFARYAMCLVAAKNNHSMASELAKNHYGQESSVAKILEGQSKGLNFVKAPVAAGTTLNSTYAAPLVPLYQTISADFIDFLRPRTIVGQFGTNGIPSLRSIPFNVRIPAQTSGARAAWVGEGAAKPVRKVDFDDVELRWAKIAAIAVLTEELIRFSDPSAERLVRDELAAAVIERMDVDFVDPAKNATSNVSPASMTYGVAGIGSTGTDADAIRCDIQALWAPFIAANNAPRSAVYIMDSTTALALSMMQNPLGQSEFPGLTLNGGTFMGVPVIVSDYVPVDSAGHMLILANASDIFLADDGQVRLDASREATIQMDDTPTQSSLTPTATAGVSMFQTNSVALRAERYINWGKRRSSAVQYLTGVNYGSCGA